MICARGQDCATHIVIDNLIHVLFVSHIPTTYQKCGLGKREAQISTLVTPEKAAPVTGTALRTTGPVPTNSRQ